MATKPDAFGAALHLMALLALASVAGCTAPVGPELDQCLRQQLFERCMASLPSGPDRTHYNDWAEVVSECASTAQYHSYRLPEHIEPACRTVRLPTDKKVEQ